jgi:hypothetical protein
MEATQETKRERYQVTMDPELHRQIRVMAADRGVRVSVMLHDVVVAGLYAIGHRKPAT